MERGFEGDRGVIDRGAPSSESGKLVYKALKTVKVPMMEVKVEVRSVRCRAPHFHQHPMDMDHNEGVVNGFLIWGPRLHEGRLLGVIDP